MSDGDSKASDESSIQDTMPDGRILATAVHSENGVFTPVRERHVNARQ